MHDLPLHNPGRRDALRTIAAGTALAAGSSLAACASLRALGANQPQPSPDLPREFRAAWVATVDNIDWPSEPGLPSRTQRDEIVRTIETAASVGLNALILQVRPTSDALYRSRLEPWSAFLTGRQGQAPVPTYDPLEVWLDEAHKAGLDLHAWVNPFRVRHPKSIGRDAPTHIANTRPDLVRTHGPYLWLDPGEPAARDYALRITDDLLARYPIDGVHMDDYFYPYPREDNPFPDEATYATHRRAHGRDLSLSDWRRANINAFIRDTAELTHTRRPGAIFTVSPFGIWRPENPPGIKGFDAYEGLHADSRRWLAEGWVDALMPQLYWPIESSGQPFEPLLDWWRTHNDKDRHLWPGLYLTRIKPAGSPDTSWQPDQIVRQIELLRTKRDTPGYELFSMVGLLENRRGIADRLRALNADPAFVPPSPWLDAEPPRAPEATFLSRTLRITPARRGPRARRWAIVYRHENRHGGTDTVHTEPASATVVTLPAGARSIRVAAVGSNGATSQAVRVG